MSLNVFSAFRAFVERKTNLKKRKKSRLNLNSEKGVVTPIGALANCKTMEELVLFQVVINDRETAKVNSDRASTMDARNGFKRVKPFSSR